MDNETPEGKIVFRSAAPDVFYVHAEYEPGAMKYVGEVRRIIVAYRNGNAVHGWERVGPKWPEKVFKRRIEAARAMM